MPTTLLAEPRASHGHVLLLGVHAWRNAESLRRRRTIRTLSKSGAVTLRFIMMAPPTEKSSSEDGNSAQSASSKWQGLALAGLDTEDGHADVLRFALPPRRHPKAVHKYLLANAFIRYAITQPHQFIGRTEDDALVDIAELGRHLERIAAEQIPAAADFPAANAPRRRLRDFRRRRASGAAHAPSSSSLLGPMLLYGIRGMWVMWDQTNLLPMCWNARWIDWKGGACDAAFVGPFLLFQGPLVVYSQPLARALTALPSFSAVEERVARNWSGIVRQRLSTQLVGAHMGIVHSGVAEDVYYSALIAHELGARVNLTIISVPMAEYPWNQARPVKQLQEGCAVYHRLTTWQHLNVSGLVGTLVNQTSRRVGRDAERHGVDRPSERAKRGDVESTGMLGAWWLRRHVGVRLRTSGRCKPFPAKFKAFRYGNEKQRATSGRYCCRNWQLCDY